MRKNAMATILDQAVNRAAEEPGVGARLKEIFIQERSVMQEWRDIIETIDTSVRENWSALISLAIHAGVTEEDMLREAGASASTLHRWLYDKVAPREGTRKLIKKAILDLLTSKSQEQGPANLSRAM